MIQLSFFSFSDTLGKAEKLHLKAPCRGGAGISFSAFPTSPKGGKWGKRPGKAEFAPLTRPSATGRGAGKTEKAGKAERQKGSEMEKVKFECWVDVPGTEGRFQVSNLGHLRLMAKKVRVMGRITLVSSVEERHLVCDYKTGRLGWWVFVDGSKLFLPRHELMALFPIEFHDIDHSQDEAANAKREETYCDPESFRKANKKRN